MTGNVRTTPIDRHPFLGRLYVLTFGLLAVSGFAQMPIFKRYYIADLPGLGWLAQYYVTHLLHYLAAALLLGIVAYAVTGFLLDRRRALRLTSTGWVRAVLLAGLLVTGALRVVKNFAGVYMSSGWIVFLDMLHLALVMGYLAVAIYALAAMGSGRTVEAVRRARGLGAPWFTRRLTRKLGELRRRWGNGPEPAADGVLELLDAVLAPAERD